VGPVAAGKTHLLTDPATIAPTLTRERMIADAEEMAAWVRRELGKDKIFVSLSWAIAGAASLAFSSRSVAPNGCTPI